MSNYAKIVQPLNQLLQGYGLHKKGTKPIVKAKTKPKKKAEWVWGNPQQTAFDEIKGKRTNPTVLAYVDYTKHFILHPDA